MFVAMRACTSSGRSCRESGTQFNGYAYVLGVASHRRSLLASAVASASKAHSKIQYMCKSMWSRSTPFRHTQTLVVRANLLNSFSPFIYYKFGESFALGWQCEGMNVAMVAISKSCFAYGTQPSVQVKF